MNKGWIYPPSQNNQNLDKIYETIVPKTLNMSNKGSSNLRQKKEMRGQVHCLLSLKVARSGNHSVEMELTVWGDQGSWSAGGEYQRGGSFTERNSQNLQMTFLKYSAEYWSAKTCAETLQSQGKNYQKAIRLLRTHTGPGRVSVSPAKLQNLMILGIGRVFKRVLGYY